MKRFTQIALVSCVGALSACTMVDDTTYVNYQTATPSPIYTYDQTQYYSQAYGGESGNYKENYYQGSGNVSVPESYHVGSVRSPQRAKDSDHSWVVNQNPQAYTIEIADDPKAAAVAGKLYQLPKNNRQAEIRYQRNGTPYYKGLYGSYSSQEEAQKALDSLPPDAKQGAGIKNWGSIQSNVSE